ncbi:MAG: RelA/SpoT family protein [Vicingaceae bacterium]
MKKTEAVLAEGTEFEKLEILKRYKSLLRATKRTRSDYDRKLIRKAFDVANEAHKNVRRKSGEPYIYHPIAVAHIVASEIGLGTTSVIAALLHDTVEDTDISLSDIEDMFGQTVAEIIDGLTKISGVVYNQSASLQAENYRKILLTLSDDVRVILIKIADRLHNMRTLDSMTRANQLKISSETLYLYAPLAHRLGLYTVKSELEDLGLKYTEPKKYKDIELKLRKTKAVRTRFMNQFSLPIKKALDDMGMNYEIRVRTKSVHAILQKMKSKNVNFGEVYDIFAIRIIVESDVDQEKSDCWKVYSAVTDFYHPNPDRLRDWISTPKINGYESLHTTVMSPTGKWVEVQIRSRRMDDIAEKGLAAHWKYKTEDYDRFYDKWLSKIRDLLESPESEALDFIDDFKLNLFSAEVYCFTPKGELKTLPSGATALDFAFDIHTEIGARCLGAKVNHELVPLSYVLKNGDQVEVITSAKPQPKEEWLNFVVTAKAKSKIKALIKGNKKKFSSLGKAALEKKFKQLKVTFNSANLNELMAIFDVKSLNELYFQVGRDKINLNILNQIDVEKDRFVLRKLKHKKSTLQRFFPFIKKDQGNLVLEHQSGKLAYSMAECCKPIPGDEVFGFAVAGGDIKVHKTNCIKAVNMMSKFSKRVLRAKWTENARVAFLTTINVTGIDDVGIVSSITRIISEELDVNMRSLNFDSHDGIFEGNITLYIQNTRHLDELVENINQVKGVISVKRAEQNEEGQVE